VFVDLEEGQSVRLVNLEDAFDREMEEGYYREGCEAEISGGLVLRYLDEE
jgi:hypothetical protein